jgi:hypothetical protein
MSTLISTRSTRQLLDLPNKQYQQDKWGALRLSTMALHLHSSITGDLSMESRITICFAMFLFFIVGAGLAYGELDQTMRADIPFDFYAGKQQMPAGLYDVRFDAGSSLVLISDRSGHHAGFLMGIKESDDINVTSGLVFDHTGDDYYLRDMKSANLEVSFPVKQYESSAALTNPSTQVVVAMNR